MRSPIKPARLHKTRGFASRQIDHDLATPSDKRSGAGIFPRRAHRGFLRRDARGGRPSGYLLGGGARMTPDFFSRRMRSTAAATSRAASAGGRPRGLMLEITSRSASVAPAAG